jgi:hypothetical protein
MADFVHDIFAEAVRIGELGSRIGNAFVDGAAEMSRKEPNKLRSIGEIVRLEST